MEELTQNSPKESGYSAQGQTDKNQDTSRVDFDYSGLLETRQRFLQVGERTLNFSLVITFTILTLLTIIFVFKDLELELDREDAWQMVSYSGSFAALCIALPHFLKDFRSQLTLSRSFLLLALLFALGSVIGLFTLIFFKADIYFISIESFLPRLFVVPLSIRVLVSASDLFPRHGRGDYWTLDYYLVFELFIIVLVIGSSLPYSNGETAAFLLMVLYASTYFIALILALVIDMVFSRLLGNRAIFEYVIVDTVNKQSHIAHSMLSLHKAITAYLTKLKLSIGLWRMKRYVKRLAKGPSSKIMYKKELDLVLPMTTEDHENNLKQLLGKCVNVWVSHRGDLGAKNESREVLMSEMAKKMRLSKEVLKYSKRLEQFICLMAEEPIIKGEYQLYIYKHYTKSLPELEMFTNSKKPKIHQDQINLLNSTVDFKRFMELLTEKPNIDDSGLANAIKRKKARFKK